MSDKETKRIAFKYHGTKFSMVHHRSVNPTTTLFDVDGNVVLVLSGEHTTTSAACGLQGLYRGLELGRVQARRELFADLKSQLDILLREG